MYELYDLPLFYARVIFSSLDRVCACLTSSLTDHDRSAINIPGSVQRSLYNDEGARSPSVRFTIPAAMVHLPVRALAVFKFLTVLVYASPLPAPVGTLQSRQSLAQVIYSCTVPNTVALTFDDGPFFYLRVRVFFSRLLAHELTMTVRTFARIFPMRWRLSTPRELFSLTV